MSSVAARELVGTVQEMIFGVVRLCAGRGIRQEIIASLTACLTTQTDTCFHCWLWATKQANQASFCEPVGGGGVRHGYLPVDVKSIG